MGRAEVPPLPLGPFPLARFALDFRSLTLRARSISFMVQFPLLPFPPLPPRATWDKVSPCGQGVGNFASSLVPGYLAYNLVSRTRNYGAEIVVERHVTEIPSTVLQFVE